MSAFSTYNGQIASRLDQYRALGQQEASQHKPPSDAAHPDVHEATLLAEAAKALANEQHVFDSVVTKASVEVTQAEQKVIALKTSAQELLGEQPLQYLIESDLSAEKSSLIRTTEERMRAETDWKFFRERNGITQQAVYPDSKVGHLGWVFVAALVETLVNAFFYENEQGLLGGFFVAMAIAAVNMGTAFLLGYGFRYKNLRAVEHKAAGWLCLAAFLLIMLYCNTLFAAFRAHYQTLTDPSDPTQLRVAFAASSKAALGVFRLNLDLPDLWSFVLFGFGLLLSCLSFWKGYTFDDEHPNYGALDRRFRSAREKEQQEQTRVRNLIRQKFQDKEARIHGLLREPAALSSSLSSRIAELTQAQSNLGASAAAVHRDFRLVLDAYRNANISVRTTEPPRYFLLVPALQVVDPSAAEQVKTSLKHVQSELKGTSEYNHTPLNEALRGIQEEATSMLATRMPQMFREIESEAQNEINRLTPTLERTGQRG